MIKVTCVCIVQVVKEWIETRLSTERDLTNAAMQQLNTASENKVCCIANATYCCSTPTCDTVQTLLKSHLVVH